MTTGIFSTNIIQMNIATLGMLPGFRAAHAFTINTMSDVGLTAGGFGASVLPSGVIDPSRQDPSPR